MQATKTLTIISPQNAIFLETNSKEITVSLELQNCVLHIISATVEEEEEPEPPDGYFTINGEKVTSDTEILVKNSEITIKFVPTENAENIKEVYCDIWKEAPLFKRVTLPSPSYNTTYTLPEPGAYKLKGYIKWTGSETPIKKLDITVTLPSPLSINQILGMTFIAIGIAIWMYPRFLKRRK